MRRNEPFPPPLGARIAGRFDILAPLRGEGPMRVFFAQDRQTGKRCALSLFDPSRTTAVAWGEYVRITAAASAARIPGLVLPSNVPSELPTPPHVVEDAPSYRALDRLLAQERRLPWQRALIIVERVAGVLHAAHVATQAAHRALTPYRIAVDSRDEVQVLDFGVSEFDLPDDSAEEPDYRAPEQRERKADAAVDVYTLALLLHGLISGTVPTGTPPPCLGSLASVPPALDPLLQSALSPNPALRLDLLTLRARMRELLGLPPLPGSDSPADPPPVTPAPKRTLASKTATPVRQRLVPAPMTERTEVLANHRPPQDTTLILPTHGDPPTEELPRASLLHPPAATPPALTRADDLAEERTSLFTRAPRIQSPDRTEVMPLRRGSITAVAVDRTERLTRTPGVAPERTESLNLRPALPQPSPIRRAPLIDADDELTIASPVKLLQQPQALPSPSSQPGRSTGSTASRSNAASPAETPSHAQLHSSPLRIILILGLCTVLILAALISVLVIFRDQTP